MCFHWFNTDNPYALFTIHQHAICTDNAVLANTSTALSWDIYSNCISIVFILCFFMSIELKDHPSCSAVFFLVLNFLRFFQHTFGTHPKQPLPTGYCIGFRAHKRRFGGIANSGCACPRGVARTFLGSSGCFVRPLRNWVGWCLWSLGTWWMGTIVVLYRRCPHLGARFLPFKKQTGGWWKVVPCGKGALSMILKRDV